MLSCNSGMELRILKAQELVDFDLVEQIFDLDRRNMESILDKAGIEFPEEKRRKGLQSDATFIIALDNDAIVGYFDYLRSWTNPDYIYIGSVQIEKRFRGTRLLLMLLDRFRTSVTDEDFVGLETNVQKVNTAAAKLYQKIGFTLENNLRNDASWIARASRDVLTESPIMTLIDRWRARKVRHKGGCL